MKINIKVIPRANRNEIVGPDIDGNYKARLTSPPVDGEANKKLLTLLSKKFNVAKSLIKIIKGERGRDKIIEL